VSCGCVATSVIYISLKLLTTKIKLSYQESGKKLMFEDKTSLKFLALIIRWVHPDKEERCVTKIQHD